MRTILLILVFLSPYILNAKNHSTRKISVEYVFSSAPKSFFLDSVEFADSATILYMSCRTIPGCQISIPECLYLEDINLDRYQLKSTIGISPDKEKICPLSGDVNFMLFFEPLKQDSKPFDLLSIPKQRNVFSIWGIHQKGKKKIWEKNEDNYRMYNDSTCIQNGTVTIKGRILEKGAQTKRDSVLLKCTNIYLERQPRKWYYLTNSDEFDVSVNIDGISWAYLEYRNRNIPIMLYPNDTIFVTIDFTKDPLGIISYQSKKENDMHAKLMHADPLVYIPLCLQESYQNLARLDELEQKCANERCLMNKLADYLSFKCKLSPMENHLLHLYLSSDVDWYQTERTCRTIEKLFLIGAQQEIYSTEHPMIPFSEEILSHLTYLRQIDVHDFSNFILPDKKRIWSVTCLPFITSYALSDKRNLVPTILKHYFGSELPDYWMQSVRNTYPGEWWSK